MATSRCESPLESEPRCRRPAPRALRTTSSAAARSSTREAERLEDRQLVVGRAAGVRAGRAPRRARRRSARSTEAAPSSEVAGLVQRRLAPVDEERSPRRPSPRRARARVGTLEPTAFTCAPGASHSRRGSAPRAARARADDVGAAKHLLGRAAVAAVSTPGSRRRGSTARIASSCERACTPPPRIATIGRVRPRERPRRHGGDRGRADLGDRATRSGARAARRSRRREGGRRPGARRGRGQGCRA